VSSEKNGLWVLCGRKTQIFLDIYVPGYAPKVRVPTLLRLNGKKGDLKGPTATALFVELQTMRDISAGILTDY
jgi:hypothetical protein